MLQPDLQTLGTLAPLARFTEARHVAGKPRSDVGERQMALRAFESLWFAKTQSACFKSRQSATGRLWVGSVRQAGVLWRAAPPAHTTVTKRAKWNPWSDGAGVCAAVGAYAAW